MGSEQDSAVLDVITSPAFQAVITLLQRPLQAQIEKLEEKNRLLELEIKKLKEHANTVSVKVQNISEKQARNTENSQDELQMQIQMEKRNNLILTGLREEKDEDLQKKLTEIFDAKFSKNGIKFECSRLGKESANEEEPDENKKPRAIKISFASIWDKRYIYANRIKNLNQSGMYLNEDLMPEQAKIAYMARVLRRNKKIHSTFTKEGNVFIKEKEDSTPKEVTKELLVNLENKEGISKPPLRPPSPKTTSQKPNHENIINLEYQDAEDEEPEPQAEKKKNRGRKNDK